MAMQEIHLHGGSMDGTSRSLKVEQCDTSVMFPICGELGIVFEVYRRRGDTNDFDLEEVRED
jgi:hypothetical protein